MTIPDDLAAVLEAACAQAGLSAAGAAPIRLGENAIFHLPGGIVARIARAGQQSVARREIAVSRWLNAAGVSAVAAWGDLDQPVDEDTTHLPFQVFLMLHVVRIRSSVNLKLL